MKIIFTAEQWDDLVESIVNKIDNSYHYAKERHDLPGYQSQTYAANRELKWSEPKTLQEVGEDIRLMLKIL